MKTKKFVLFFRLTAFALLSIWLAPAKYIFCSSYDPVCMSTFLTWTDYRVISFKQTCLLTLWRSTKSKNVLELHSHIQGLLCSVTILNFEARCKIPKVFLSKLVNSLLCSSKTWKKKDCSVTTYIDVKSGIYNAKLPCWT